MTDLLSSLPGDIPGLLRRGSPIIAAETYCGVVAEMEALDNAPALDLTDPTGRAHAAAWVLSQRATTSSIDEAEALRLALVWSDMTPAQIDILARLVLRLAGRTP